MIRLLIADDHQILREGLKHVVAQSHDIKVVGEADDGDAALELCRATVADVVLLDVSMPGPGVLELIARLKELRPNLRILVLSMHPEGHYARRVLAAGADGYLTKNQSSRALAAAIREVYNGRKYLSPSLAQELAMDLTKGRPRQNLHESLSNREYQTLLQFGAGKSVQEIAEQLKVSPKTVRTYRARILEKTNLRSTAEIIYYAISQGLVEDVAVKKDPPD